MAIGFNRNNEGDKLSEGRAGILARLISEIYEYEKTTREGIDVNGDGFDYQYEPEIKRRIRALLQALCVVSCIAGAVFAFVKCFS
jgi:hypothetical protein